MYQWCRGLYHYAIVCQELRNIKDMDKAMNKFNRSFEKLKIIKSNFNLHIIT